MWAMTIHIVEARIFRPILVVLNLKKFLLATMNYSDKSMEVEAVMIHVTDMKKFMWKNII